MNHSIILKRTSESPLFYVRVVFLLIFIFPVAVFAQETSGGFSEGSVLIGYDNRTCTSTLAGAIRYNSASSVEFCDGTSWAAPSSGGAPDFSGPTGCANVGDQCADSTIYAGIHPTSHVHIFLHPNNQSTSSAWSTEDVVTNATDPNDGGVNQDWIVANKTITVYPAFKDCDDLNGVSSLGYTDWYLPSRIELNLLWIHYADINAGPGDSFLATQYWSSTEFDFEFAFAQTIADAGASVSAFKGGNKDVRCIRRN